MFKRLISIILCCCFIVWGFNLPYKATAADNTVTVTFINGGTTENISYSKGEKISFPTLSASANYDHTWSQSNESFVAPPLYADQSLTLYAFKNPVLSFENCIQYTEKPEISVYKPFFNYDFEFNAMPSNNAAYSGNSSVKLENIGLFLLETEPGSYTESSGNSSMDTPEEKASFVSSWVADCKAGKYFFFNVDSGKWEKIPTDRIPEFAPYTYARQRISVETGLIPVRLFEGAQTPLSFKYKITFKYLATENNTQESTLSAGIFCPSNMWWGYKAITGSFTFPKGASDGWQTGEMYVEADQAVIQGFSSFKHLLSLKWNGSGQASQMPGYTNEIYIDCITIEENYQNTLRLTLHNGQEQTVITEGLDYGKEYPLPVPNAQSGQYFMGWYYDSTLTRPVYNFSFPNADTLCDLHLYAKFGNHLKSESYSLNYTNIPTLKGYAYSHGGAYTQIALNEKTWGYKGCSSEGIVLGKDNAGSAYKWSPDLADTTEKHTQNTNINDILAIADDSPVGTKKNVGWGESVNFVLRDQQGNAVIAQPNSVYAVAVTYKKLSEGSQSLGIGIGRKAEFVSTASDAYSLKSYNRFGSTITKDLTAAAVSDEYQTETFYIYTRDFSDGDVPVISLHSYYSGYYAQRIEADQNGVESYTVADGTTYYPYKIISTPKIAVSAVSVLKIEEGYTAVTYNTYQKGLGFSAKLAQDKQGNPLLPTGNIDTKWYKFKNGLLDTLSAVPDYHTTLYNADYYMANRSEENNIFGSNMQHTSVLLGGNQVPAVKYSSNTATKGDVLRLGRLSKGHTYKLTLSLKAQVLSSDMSLTLTTADGKSADIGSNPILTQSITAADYTGNWQEKTFYFTAEPIGIILNATENGAEYSLDNDCYYLYLQLSRQNSGENTLYIAGISLTDLGTVISYGGASVLKSEAEKAANGQAMRHYFSYNTDNGENVIIDGTAFKVVERGFIYRDGSAELTGGTVYEKGGFYANASQTKSGFVKQSKTDGFDTCWSISGNTLTFSTYVKGFYPNGDKRKLQIKAYLIFEDQNGSRHIIHSPFGNRTVDAIKNGVSQTDSPLNGRRLIWAEEFSQNNIGELNTFTQKFDTMFTTDDNLVTSTSQENYFIDSSLGELVLRNTSDGKGNYKTAKSVTTREIMVYKYGYLEMRAKIPYMKCAWPSFWLQPDKSPWNASRYNGEIDIFEVFGNQTDTVCNLHKWPVSDNGTSVSDQIGNRGNILYGSRTHTFENEAMGDQYHTYGFEWTPEFIAFYIDGVMYCKIDITDQTGEYSKENPGMGCFHRYVYICLNNWLFTEQQSSWVKADNLVENNPDLGSIDYRVDYMRLYQGADEEICLY